MTRCSENTAKKRTQAMQSLIKFFYPSFWFKSDYALGLFWKFFSTTCFATISMLACWIQFRGMRVSPSQIAFFQVFLPFVGMLVLTPQPSGTLVRHLLTRAPLWALLRSGASSITFLSWFCALSVYPLSFAISFRMLGPLVTFGAALLLLKEKTTLLRFLGLCILLLASTLLIRAELWSLPIAKDAPLFQLLSLPLLVIFGYALTTLSGKLLLKRVEVKEALFSLLGLNSLFLGLAALLTWAPLEPSLYGFLALMGFIEWLGQWALAKALSMTALNVLAPLSLWRFGISALFGLVILGEPLRPAFLIGIALMVLATPLVIRKR